VNGPGQPTNQPPLQTAEPATVQTPGHPVHALTTYELARYRRELEHALKTLPGHAEIRALLQQRLADVLDEQQARTQLQEASRTGTTGR
jgi:hypothetical protein